MEVFGFSAQSRDLIYLNICNIEYQFRINGKITGSFRSSQGVRQGDPLLPLLFVLAQQILTLNLKKRIDLVRITGFKVGNREVSVSHLLYADNILIFTNGALSSLSNLIELLRAYEKSSGQLLVKQRAAITSTISSNDVVPQYLKLRDSAEAHSP